MKNQKFKVQPSTLDYSVEVAALLVTAFSLILPLFFSHEIPGKVPTHFNLSGQPDVWKEHGSLWLFPEMGLIIFIALTVLNRFPFLYRYPVKVTDANVQILYTLGTRTIRILKLLITSMFFCLTFDSIKIGLNQSTGSSEYYLPFFLIACIVLVVTMIYKMKNKQNFINKSSHF